MQGQSCTEVDRQDNTTDSVLHSLQEEGEKDTEKREEVDAELCDRSAENGSILGPEVNRSSEKGSQKELEGGVGVRQATENAAMAGRDALAISLRDMEGSGMGEKFRKMEEEVKKLGEELGSSREALNASGQKQAGLREKLSMAVKKGKEVVIQREGLKSYVTGQQAEIDRLGAELAAVRGQLDVVETAGKSRDGGDVTGGTGEEGDAGVWQKRVVELEGALRRQEVESGERLAAVEKQLEVALSSQREVDSQGLTQVQVAEMLQAQLEEASVKTEEVQKKLQAKDAEVEALQSQLEVSNGQVEESVKKMSEVGEELEVVKRALESEKESATQVSTDLKRELREGEGREVTLVAKLQEEERRVEGLEKMLADREEQVIAEQASAATQVAACQALTEDLEVVLGEREERKGVDEQLSEAVATLKERVEKQERDVSALRAEAEAERQGRVVHQERSEGQVAEAQEKVDIATAAVAAVEGRMADLQDQMALAKEEAESNAKLVDALKAEVELGGQRMMSAQEETARLGRKLQEVIAVREGVEGDLKDVKEKLAMAVQMGKKVEKQNEELNGKLKVALAGGGEAEETKREVGRVRDELAEKVEALDTAAGEQRAMILRMQAEREELQVKLTTAEEELEEACREREEVQESLKDARNQAKELAAEVSRVKALLVNREEEVTHVKDQVVADVAALKGLRKEKVEVMEGLAGVRRQYEQLEVQLESERNASLADLGAAQEKARRMAEREV